MFYNARMYDPALGRFTSADSVIPGGAHPHSRAGGLDRYAYVNNSPVNFTDPTGHISCIDGEYCGTGTNYDNALQYTPPSDPPPAGGGGGGNNPCVSVVCLPKPELPVLPTIPIGLPTIPNQECTSTHPCLGEQNENIIIQNPSDPDYWSLQGSFSFVAVSITIDRYGNVYVAGGVNGGSSWVIGGSGAIVAGRINDQIDSVAPPEDQMEEFLQGPAITASGGILGGGGVTYSPWAKSSGDAFAPDRFSYEIGAYSPQIGVTATWGFELINVK